MPSRSPRRTTGIRSAAIWAIQAGKDVYVEKPVSHNVWEGRQLVKARGQVQAHRADGHAEPLRRRPRARRSNGCKTGRSASSSTRAAFATSAAPSIGKVTQRTRRARRTSTTTCGAARRAMKPLMRDEAALRLALGLEHRQRRPRQPGHPPDGHRPLVPRRGCALARGLHRRRTPRLRRRRRDAEHACSSSTTTKRRR